MNARILVGLGLSLITLGASLFPGERHLQNVEHYLQWAEELSGYQRKGEVPVIVMMSEDQISAEYCRGSRLTANCSVCGFYRPGNKIYVSTDPECKPEGTVIHELTHYLHVVNGRFKSRCWSEREAARTEWAYFAVHGSTEEFQFDNVWYNCP